MDAVERIEASYQEEQDRRSRERQLVLLGAMFASERVRSDAAIEWFADYGLREAAAEMLGGGSAQKWGLQTFANSIGLGEWDARASKPGSFLSLLGKHCETDAQIKERLVDVLRVFQSAERSAHGTLAEKQEALERAKRLVSEAFGAMRDTALSE